MNAKRKMKNTALETARREINDAKTLAGLLVYKLGELERKATQHPRHWGYAGDGAHIRGRLEELLAGLYGFDGDTEEDIARQVRSQAGIKLTRDWE